MIILTPLLIWILHIIIDLDLWDTDVFSHGVFLVLLLIAHFFIFMTDLKQPLPPFPTPWLEEASILFSLLLSHWAISIF